MSFETMGLDAFTVYKTRQSSLHQQPAPATALPETPPAPRHVTRILGKLCFSCRSVNPLTVKFCSECGAPLFRPCDSQMLRSGL